MTSVIDHTSFPVFVGKIIDAADFNTLLKFRGTSKAYFALISTTHFRHLLADIGDGPDDFVNDSQGPWTEASPAGFSRPTVFNSTQIVDVHVLGGIPGRINLLYYFPSAHTIRRLSLNCTLHPMTHLDNMRTVVDFVHTVVSAAEAKENLGMINVSYDVERQIIHYCWKDHRLVPHLIFQKRPHKVKLQEIVIALWPLNEGRCPSPQAVWSLVVGFAAHVEGSIALKIVGIEKLNFGCNIAPHDMSRRTIAFLDGLWNRLDYFTNPAQVLKKIKPLIIFRTFDQWWHELGCNKDIHGMWNPLYEVVVSVIHRQGRERADATQGVDDDDYTSPGETDWADDDQCRCTLGPSHAEPNLTATTRTSIWCRTLCTTPLSTVPSREMCDGGEGMLLRSLG